MHLMCFYKIHVICTYGKTIGIQQQHSSHVFELHIIQFLFLFQQHHTSTIGTCRWKKNPLRKIKARTIHICYCKSIYTPIKWCFWSNVLRLHFITSLLYIPTAYFWIQLYISLSINWFNISQPMIHIFTLHSLLLLLLLLCSIRTRISLHLHACHLCL